MWKEIEVIELASRFEVSSPQGAMIYELYRRGLTIDQAEVYVHRLAGMTNNEIAEMRGTHRQTVANLTQRARDRIKELNMDYCTHCIEAFDCRQFITGYPEQATVCKNFRNSFRGRRE